VKEGIKDIDNLASEIDELSKVSNSCNITYSMEESELRKSMAIMSQYVYKLSGELMKTYRDMTKKGK
jgi:hypothetical protein